MTAQQSIAARRKARMDSRYTSNRKDPLAQAKKLKLRVAAEQARKSRKK